MVDFTFLEVVISFSAFIFSSKTLSSLYITETDGDGRMDIVKRVNGNQTTAIVSFRNLTLRDSKVLQCNISNKHGYIFTNTYINVLGDIRGKI